jgi:hypothetical protein
VALVAAWTICCGLAAAGSATAAGRLLTQISLEEVRAADPPEDNTRLNGETDLVRGRGGLISRVSSRVARVGFASEDRRPRTAAGMSATAIAAAAVLGLWLAGSICFALRVPVAFPALRRINQFRLFSDWRMFSGPSMRAAGYIVEYRPRAGDDQPWQRWTLLPAWHPLGWIINPRRPPAEALQRLAQRLDRRLHEAPASARAGVCKPFESVIERAIDSRDPRRSPVARQVRILRDRGSGTTVIWSFTTADDADA